MFNIKHNFVRALALATLFSIPLCLGLAPSVSAGVINLGGAADYAVVAVGGSAGPPVVQSHFKLYQSGTVVNGNVAEGPYTSLDHVIDATVNGRWDYDLTDINPLVEQPGSNTPSGGFHQMNLARWQPMPGGRRWRDRY